MRGEGPLELTLPPLLCNRYVGHMDRGKRTGEGTFYYSTGAQYKVGNKIGCFVTLISVWAHGPPKSQVRKSLQLVREVVTGMDHC